MKNIPLIKNRLGLELFSILEAACIVNFFTKSLLDQVFGEKIVAKNFEKFSSGAWIKKYKSDEFAVETEVRDKVLRYIWETDREKFKDYSKRAYEGFRDLNMQKSSLRLFSQEIYHMIIVEPDQALQRVKQISEEWCKPPSFANDRVEHLMEMLNEHGHNGRLDEEVRIALIEVQSALGILDRANGRPHNPYKGLAVCDIDDDYYFHGRDELVRDVINTIEADHQSNVSRSIRIQGYSGSGKSSFLRAGVFRSLKYDDGSGVYFCLAVRPEDFQDQYGHSKIPTLSFLVAKIGREIGLDVLGILRELENKSHKTAVDFVLREVEACLAEKKRAILVLGLDQFEEIVDVLTDSEKKKKWQPLLDFLTKSEQIKSLKIIYTLETSRLNAFERLQLNDTFGNSYSVDLDLTEDDELERFFRTIITVPFKSLYSIPQTKVDELIDKAFALHTSETSNSKAAILPLLVLKMREIFDTQVQKIIMHSSFSEEHPTKLLKQSPVIDSSFNSAADKETPAQKYLETEELEFTQMIASLAENAWERAGITNDRSNLPWFDDNDEKDINVTSLTSPEDIEFYKQLEYFLLPFVGVDNGRIQLRSIPRKLGYANEQKLVKAFYDARL
ncbi:MAG: ATP-binding protein, partial [Verrucomicrobiota bacterium]